MRLRAALCELYGITRIAETTYLDRIGIPCVNVYAPDTRDLIGVYNGKGLTREQAIVSGLMEALERQICARCDLPRYERAASDIVRYLDLRALGWIGADDAQIECVTGTDLLSGESIAVPIGVVQCPRAGPRQFAITSTNGLASGNTAVEAAYHALFELCERHLWSQVHVLSHIWPRLLRSRMGDGSEQPDDPVAHEVVVTPETPIAGELVEHIRRAGLEFRLICFARAGWPIAMQACIIDRSGEGMFYHLGMGCSWSPLHAATRAITEAAQVRLGDISGAREDLWVGQASAHGFDHGTAARGLSGWPLVFRRPGPRAREHRRAARSIATGYDRRAASVIGCFASER